MEAQERKELQARRLAEEDDELFVDAFDEEESEDELYDDALDEMDEEEETDEPPVNLKEEGRPRRRIPMEGPPISDAEEEIVGQWK